MEPEKYFPDKYYDDLTSFVMASKTKSFDLCPLMLGEQLLGEQLKDGGYGKYASVVDFFACQYCLNLISQGIHSYTPEFYLEWLDKGSDYLNVQGCHAHSFGNGVSRPIDLLIYLQKFDVNVEELKVYEYLNFFLYDVLTITLPDFNVTDLVDRLMEDTDCAEIHTDLHEMRKTREIYYSKHQHR